VDFTEPAATPAAERVYFNESAMSSEEAQFAISPSAYEWTSRLFDLLRRVLKVKVNFHHDEGQIEESEIFVFNHFARFETFIPQYLIYKSTGDFCRSIAAGELFVEGDPFSSYLRSVGAVSNQHSDLFAFLSREIFRGRKVIIFPEGGMVKDRRVMNEDGDYSVFSRSAQARRKHHTGAAVLALAVEAMKAAVKDAHKHGNMRRIEAWSEYAGLDSPEDLIRASRRPTRIVPATITFYPIRVSDNLLRKGAELLNRGLSRRLSEELLIEGNILLKDTDMDIRLGESIRIDRTWSFVQRALVSRVVRTLGTFDEIFSLTHDAGWWAARMLARGMLRNAVRIRDDYMHRMYSGVTVNLSHLASSLMVQLLERGVRRIPKQKYHLLLYLCLKRAQREPSLHLHESICNPDIYARLPDGICSGLDQFLKMATSMRLVEEEREEYQFLKKFDMEHTFDSIRLENLVEVYANEMAPLKGARLALRDAMREADKIRKEELAALRFDDLKISHVWDKAMFSAPRHQAINARETATEPGEPFLLLPKNSSKIGVVLVHGFLASPAEVRGMGEELVNAGHPVVGVRLKGHGTSPWDLRERSFRDWLESVRAGCRIIGDFSERFCIVGFSTGGALALLHAAESKAPAGVAAISVPIIFGNRNMRFVPLVHGANRLVRAISPVEGVMPFRPNQSEHPHINYYHMPIRGLNELRLLRDELRIRSKEVRCPVLLLQGDKDPVVDAKSMGKLRGLLSAAKIEAKMIPSKRHGILYEDIGGTVEIVLDYVARLNDEESRQERAAGDG
jgi:esterase/lipase